MYCSWSWFEKNLDLDLVSLFSVLHLSVFVAQLCFLLFELTLRDFPEGVDFISFQLEVVALLSLAVEFFAKTHNVLFQLNK